MDPLPTWYFDVPMNISITVIEYNYVVAYNDRTCLRGKCHTFIHHLDSGHTTEKIRLHSRHEITSPYSIPKVVHDHRFL